MDKKIRDLDVGEKRQLQLNEKSDKSEEKAKAAINNEGFEGLEEEKEKDEEEEEEEEGGRSREINK